MQTAAYWIWFISIISISIHMAYGSLKGNPMTMRDFKWFMFGLLIIGVPVIFINL